MSNRNRCSSSHTFKALLALGAVCVAAAAVVLGPAAAADGPGALRAPILHGLAYIIEQKTISDADPTELVDCPSGSAPAGGGTFFDTANPADTQLTNSTPFPAGDPNQDPDEGWLAEGNPTSTASMFTYAICSNRPGKLRYRSDSVLAGPGASTPVTASCPSGTALTGGGALTDSDLGDMILIASRPHSPGGGSKPRQWYAAAHNYDAIAHGLVAYAICSKQKDKYSYKHKTVPIPDASPGSAHKVVKCGRDRVVSGGGAGIAGGAQAGDNWLVSSSPQPAGVFDPPPKKGWIAEGVSYEAETLEVWAICKK